MAQLTLSAWNQQNSGTVNLTSTGAVNWVHETNVATYERKSGGGTTFGLYTMVGGGSPPANQYTNDSRTFSWTNGTTVPSGSDTNGLYAGPPFGSVGVGFSVTFAADTTIQVIRFYCGQYHGQGQLTATLSDASAGPASVLGINDTAGTVENGHVDITFQAASAGQTLTVTWLISTVAVADCNPSIQGAALMSVTNPAPDQPQDIDWSWGEDVGEPDGSELGVHDPVGANAPPNPLSPFPYDWPFDEDVGEDAPLDEYQSASVAAAPPMPATDDWWSDDDYGLVGSVADDYQQSDIAPLYLDVEWNWDIDQVDDDLWWTELPLLLIDAVAPVIVVIQDDPDFQQDLGDEQLEDSGPVGANVTPADQQVGETWFDDDATDELLEDSGPVGANAVAADQPPSDAWDWDAQQVDDDAWWFELPVQLLDAPVNVVLQDEPALEQDVGDEQLDESAPVGDDEPPLTVADAWNWDEEPADDDTHWQIYEQPLIDFASLPGPTYAEDWDWNGEDTEDDAQFLEPTQPDTSAVGPPTPSGPTNAELLAMIQALQAKLDDVAKRAGSGGGGGDPVEHQLYRSRDARRERINAQNALLMALVGSMMANRFGGKITTNKDEAGGVINPTREGKQP